jgi:hypothetical protein
MITIVSGLPRSGTSLLMQMLAAGGLPALTDGRRGADEDNPRGYFELEAVKQTRRDASWLDRADGKAVKVVSHLLFDLPADRHYAVVFVLRPIPEILASQTAMLRRHGLTGAEVEEGKLAAAYEEHLEEVRMWLAGQPNFRVLYLNYGDVIQHPSSTAAQLGAFLGGGLDAGAMTAAVDPNLYRQRKGEA